MRIVRACPPGLREVDGCVVCEEVRGEKGEEVGFALGEGEGPWLGGEHDWVEDAFNADVRGSCCRMVVVFVGDGVEELTACSPDGAGVLE